MGYSGIICKTSTQKCRDFYLSTRSWYEHERVGMHAIPLFLDEASHYNRYMYISVRKKTCNWRKKTNSISCGCWWYSLSAFFVFCAKNKTLLNVSIFHARDREVRDTWSCTTTRMRACQPLTLNPSPNSNPPAPICFLKACLISFLASCCATRWAV